MELTRKEIGNLLEKKGDWVFRYPACSYEIYQTMLELDNVLEKIDDNSLKATIHYFLETMDCIWFSISSAASENIPLEIQFELIKMIGNFWKKIGKPLKKNKIPEFHSILKKPNEIREFIRSKNRELSHLHVRETLQEEDFSDIQSEMELKNKLIQLLRYYKGDSKYGVIRESSDPIFMFKSGYRSFSFFNMDKAAHNPKISPLITEILKIEIKKLKEKTKEDKINIDKLLFLEKGPGETEALAPMISHIDLEFNIPSAVLPTPTRYSCGELIKGIQIEEGEIILIIDDVITTGSGIIRDINRIENMKGKYLGSIIFFDRQLKELPTDKNIITIFNKNDFLKEKLIEPDILFLSIEDPLWASLNMRVDYLKDICFYAEQEDAYIILLSELQELMDNYAKNDDLPNEIITFIINLEILCWNYINKLLFGEYISKENVFESIIDYFNYEIGNKFIIEILFNAVEKELNKENIKDFNEFRDFIIINQKEIINLINLKLKEKNLINLEKESISKENFEKIIQKYLQEFENHYKNNMEKYNIDTKKIEELKEINKKEKTLDLKLIYDIV